MSRRILLSLLGFSLVLPSTLAAWEQPFDPPQLVDPAFADAEALQAADLDGDGRLDLVAAGASGVAWWRENLGIWTKTAIGAVAAADLAIADLDHDGDLDVAIALPSSGLVLMRNTAGDGSAWSATTIQGAASGVAIAIGDLDRDGKPDVAAALAGSIEWWRNSVGDGSTWVRQNVLTIAGASGVAIGDLDRDGDADLAFAAAGVSDTVGWLRNGLPGAFTRFDLRTGFLGARGVRVADLDQDAFPDVAAAAVDSGQLRWWRNDHTPSDGGWVDQLIASPAGLRGVEASDLDRDGDIDLVELAGDAVSWRENQPGPTPFATVHGIATVEQARGAALADLDQDGDYEVLAGGATGDELVMVDNRSDHLSVAWRPRVDLQSPLDGARAVDAGDLDGDGDLDLIAVAFAGAQVLWVENLGGTFSTHVLGTLTSAFGVALGDLDRDGDLDVVATGQTINTVAWWRNDGAGVFTRFNIDTVFLGARGVAVGDLDRDGDPDVVAAGTSDDLAIYFNNGTASSFTRVFIATTFNGAQSVAVGDVDGDGDQDVFAAGYTADEVAWWDNTAGDASAWAKRTVSGAALDGAYSVRGADIDGDGDLDLLSSADQIDKISFWENDGGDGLTWTEHSLGFFNQAQAAVAADIDRDGDLDVVGAAWKDGGKVAYFRNNDGVGDSWTKLELTGAFDGAGSVVVADFDRDGLPDVAASAETADLLSLFSHGGGQFSLIPTLTAASLPVNTRTSLFKLVITPRGGATEGDVELASINLRLEEAPGDPLIGSEADAVLDLVEIRRDNPSGGVVGSLDATDFGVTSQGSFPLGPQGELNIGVADGAANAAIAQGATATFFVAFTTVPSYAAVPLTSLRVSQLGERVEDRDYDTSLRPESSTLLSSTTFPINTLADLSLDVVDSADPIAAGGQLTYTLAIQNHGPNTAAAPALTLTLPAQTTLVSTTGCTQDPTGVPTCTLPALTNGATAQVTLVVALVAGASGTLDLAANVASTTFDQATANNDGHELTTVIAAADLAITIESSNDYGDNQPLPLRVVVTNNGPGPTTGAALSVDLPAQLTNITFTCTGTGGGQCTPTGGGGDLADLVDLPPGATVTYQIATQVPDGLTATLQATATITPGVNTNDATPTNNTDTQSWLWGNPLFYDGFESGSLGAWSGHVP